MLCPVHAEHTKPGLQHLAVTQNRDWIRIGTAGSKFHVSIIIADSNGYQMDRFVTEQGKGPRLKLYFVGWSRKTGSSGLQGYVQSQIV